MVPELSCDCEREKDSWNQVPVMRLLELPSSLAKDEAEG